MDKDQLRELAESLLTNENGINEHSWGLLRKQLIEAGIYEEFRSRVDATDGAFYIKELSVMSKLKILAQRFQ